MLLHSLAAYIGKLGLCVALRHRQGCCDLGKVKVLVAQSCPALCDPIDCSLPGSSVYGILQTRILEWVAIPFSRGSSPPRDWTQVSYIAGRFFTTEPLAKTEGKKMDPFADSVWVVGSGVLPSGATSMLPTKEALALKWEKHAWPSGAGTEDVISPCSRKRWNTAMAAAVKPQSSYPAEGHRACWRALCFAVGMARGPLGSSPTASLGCSDYLWTITVWSPSPSCK